MGDMALIGAYWAEGGSGETFGDWSGVDGGGGDGSTGEISLGAGAESGIDPGGDEGQVYIGSDDPGSYNGITDLPLSDDPSLTTIDPGTADSLGLGTGPGDFPSMGDIAASEYPNDGSPPIQTMPWYAVPGYALNWLAEAVLTLGTGSDLFPVDYSGAMIPSYAGAVHFAMMTRCIIAKLTWP